MRQERFFWSIILTAAVLLIGWPLYSADVGLCDDVCVHLARIEGIYEGLLAGQFPVRIHAAQGAGFGMPSGIFYPDLFLYLPAGLRLLGLPLGVAYHVFVFLLQFATAFIGWYAFSLLGRSWRTGAVASLVYLGFQYRLIDFYVRGAMGEMISMVFFPLALAGMLEVLRGKSNRWPLVVLAYTGIIQAHILSTLLAVLVAVLLCVCYWRRLLERERRRAFLKAIGFTALVNLWFLVPFLMFYQGMDFNMKSYVTLFHDTAMSWAEMRSMQLLCGIPVLLLCLGYAGWLLRRYYREGRSSMEDGTLTLFLLLAGLFGIGLGLRNFPWEAVESIPVLGRITVLQFPWRLAGLSAVCLSFVAAQALVRLFRGRRALAAAGLFICGWGLFSLACIPAHYHSQDMNLRTPCMPEWVQTDMYVRGIPYTPEEMCGIGNMFPDDYLYRGMRFHELRNRNDEPLTQDDVFSTADLEAVSKQGTTMSFVYASAVPTEVQLPLFYFPGYVAKSETGAELELRQTEQHVLLVEVPAGRNEVHVWYAGLPVWRFSDLLSLLGVGWFMFCLYRGRSFLHIQNGEFHAM